MGVCDGTLDITERAAISYGGGVCDGTRDSTERAAISHGGGVCDLGHRGGSAGGLGSQNISFPLRKCIFLTAQVVTVQYEALMHWKQKYLIFLLRKCIFLGHRGGSAGGLRSQNVSFP